MCLGNVRSDRDGTTVKLGREREAAEILAYDAQIRKCFGAVWVELQDLDIEPGCREEFACFVQRGATGDLCLEVGGAYRGIELKDLRRLLTCGLAVTIVGGTVSRKFPGRLHGSRDRP